MISHVLYASALTLHPLCRMIDAADTDKDGRVNISEFIKLMS